MRRALLSIALVTVASCDPPRAPTAPPDSPSTSAAIAPAAPAAATPAVSVTAAAPAPARPPAPFPPPPFELVAEIDRNDQSLVGHGYCFVVRPEAVGDYLIPVGNCGAGTVSDDPDRATPLLRARGDVCERVLDRAAGWPVFGVLDLNQERDRLFGVQHAPAQVVAENEHPGARAPVAIDLDAASPGWMVSTRREPDSSWRVGSELFRWATRWSLAEASPLGVEWRFVRPFGHGLLLIARDVREVGGRVSGRWSIVPRGIAKGVVAPQLAPRDDEALCGARVLRFEVFPSGEVLSVGGTCEGKLLVEHWAAGARDPRAQVVATIDLGILDQWPAAGRSVRPVHDWDVPVEIRGPSQLRARAANGQVFDVDLDAATGEWVPHPSTEKLAVDRARAILAPYAADFLIGRVDVGSSGALYVSGEPRARAQGGAHRKTLLLRDRPTKTACAL